MSLEKHVQLTSCGVERSSDAEEAIIAQVANELAASSSLV